MNKRKKEIVIRLLKEGIRLTFPSEQLRKEFVRELYYLISKEARTLGIRENKKFLYLKFYYINNEEIGATFRLLQQWGYETKE